MTRVALIGGKRTPFCRAGTHLRSYSFLDLGMHVAEATMKSLQLRDEEIDEVSFSTVLLDPRYPNAARELVLRSKLSNRIGAHFVSNNCISGLVAATFIGDSIQSGRIQSGLAGGAESMSQPSLTFSRQAERFFLGLSSARSLGQRLKQLATFRPGFLLPVPPSPKEPSTGMTMGQHCELTAKEFHVTREAQDAWAFRSHQNAAKAAEAGYLAEEIAPIGKVDKDNFIRPDTSIEKLSSLKPVFDRSDKGTLTAGNSSGLTDGASMVCLMSEEKARADGREILAYLDDVEFAAIDPNDGLLMAPTLAVPKLLERKGLTVGDIDLFEIHEAFAAQVISNRIAWEKGWEKYSELKAIGSIPDEKINVNGGSVAIGHPFAATGGRLLLAAAHELKRSNKKKAVISVCAAGAMAAAVLLSRD
ncbi:MAG: acetyl-CoA C-acyltransferase [Bdellovibrionales bacterium]|nr:acetyl-CoA C-acyltransferase [Bdellovibrionales bacterium]